MSNDKQVSHIPEGLHEAGEHGIVPVEFLTGAAGTGKTFEIMRRMSMDPNYGLLAATTGIAAMNLGTITINSLLGYFDTESLEESFYSGHLGYKLRELSKDGKKWLVIDEISMMDARQLDIIYQAMKQVNETIGMELDEAGRPYQPLGLVLTGDFMQLPPIKAKWVFEAQCWPEFEAATTRLTKVWRQADAQFLEAINAIRRGDGAIGSAILARMGVEFVRASDSSFDGTTIMAKNRSVDNFNWVAHSRLAGVPWHVASSRWGEQRPEWKHVPESLQLKPGAYVMILSNDTPEFSYVNGDCGHIESYDEDLGYGAFTIKLVRNEQLVRIPKLTRLQTQKYPPDHLLAKHPGVAESELRREYRNRMLEGGDPYYDTERRRWVVGGVNYFPLRLAYASTVHKCQGLTLDRIQVDINDHFFGTPAMAYVALSRCRSAQGLRIVGSPQLLASRVKVCPEVLRWL